MTSIVLAMLSILTLASGVLLYVAFPHRGVQVPAATWRGGVLRKTGTAPTPSQHDGG